MFQFLKPRVERYPKPYILRLLNVYISVLQQIPNVVVDGEIIEVISQSNLNIKHVQLLDVY